MLHQCPLDSSQCLAQLYNVRQTDLCVKIDNRNDDFHSLGDITEDNLTKVNKTRIFCQLREPHNKSGGN